MRKSNISYSSLRTERSGDPQSHDSKRCSAIAGQARNDVKLYITRHYDSPIGMLRLIESEKGIVQIQFAFDVKEQVHAGEAETPLLQEAVRQLEEYFAGRLRQFTLPLDLQGTDFQLRTWHALQDIPYGETRTYKQIAEAVGCPKGCRAVGLANNRNPIPIIIPCHRVIGSNGALTGYAGGLDVKEKLLAVEQNIRFKI